MEETKIPRLTRQVKQTYIELIKTKGCEACEIQYNKLHDICQDKNIVLITYDKTCVSKGYLDAIEAGDFPITVFVKENRVMGKIEGTCSEDTILNAIDEYLN